MTISDFLMLFSPLLQNGPVLLTVIITLGILLGNIKVFHFSLDSAGIIFVALFFGHYGFLLSQDFLTLGLMLFLYSVGIEAGPTFFYSFRKDGLRLNLAATLVVLSGVLATIVFSLLANISVDTAAGMFAGSLTSTPGLAVAVELTSPQKAPAAYGLTYSFGIIGVVLFVKLLPRFLTKQLPLAEQELDKEEKERFPRILYHNIILNNPNLYGVKIKDIGLKAIAPVVISRLLRQGDRNAVMVSGETPLQKGDRMRIVGSEKDLTKAELYLGKKTTQKIEFGGDLVNKKILVSKKNFVGQRLKNLNLAETFNVQVTRITRANTEMTADANFILRMGDSLHVLGAPESIQNVIRLLGDDAHKIQATNVFSTFLGLLIGVILGQISFPLPFVGSIQLGLSGGVLFAGILVGYLGRSGPVLWEVPWSGKKFLREVGLALFLAVVGTSAGEHFVDTVKGEGLLLFSGGIFITIFSLSVSWFIVRPILKINIIKMFGVLTGGMTSTPGLAATSSVSTNPQLAMSYASVYPVSLVMMIVSMKLLIFVLGFFS